MLLFLKIVAAVILVLALLALVAWWGVKRWLRRRIGDFAATASLLDPRYQAPARIRLRRAEVAADDIDPAFSAAWQALHALGFRPLADLAGHDDEPAMLRAAAHAELPCAAALGQWGDTVCFAVFALGDDQRLRAISDGPGETLQEGTLHWEVCPGIAVEDAFRRLQEDAAGRDLRRFDLALFRQVFERAWARRQDAFLLQPPRHEALLARAAEQPNEPDEAQIERAWQIERGQWQDRLREALLDHYRQTHRIEAEQWERIGDELQVVHGRLAPEDIRDLLVEDDGEGALWQQLVAQGHRGVALYEALAGRLPEARQRQLLAELRHPLPARIYRLLDDAAAATPARAHLYEATDDSGRTVHGAVLARSAGEAKQQLDAQGLGAARIVSESVPGGELPDYVFDPELAALAARSARDSLPMALLRSLRGNLWLWAPPTLICAWNLVQGPPYGWGDWLGFGYLGLALFALAVFVAPMILYNQLQHARLHARWGTARFCLALLRRLNLLGGLRGDQLLLEEAKVLAGAGQRERALTLWAGQAAQLDAAQYQSGLLQLCDTVGDLPGQIAAQRRLLALSASDLVRIDLAMALLRHGEAVDEAEDLLAGIDPRGLAELSLAGFHFARGLLADRRQHHEQALRHYARALEQAGQFRNMPLVLALMAEINGFSALALKRQGDTERADGVWRSVRPLLDKHASGRQIIAQYEGVLAG